MNEIQSSIHELLIENPGIKSEVQQNVRNHMQHKPDVRVRADAEPGEMKRVFIEKTEGNVAIGRVQN
ncbi:MAG: hypothetical protein IJO53_12140, partial [Clostridia bacterium]|nr:hypothetical protein [Clostridia bacterium]